jgi:Tol biopolymer transport system component
MRSRLIRAALVTAAAGLAAPAAANATLVYTKVVKNKESVWIASNDGSGARKLAGNAGLPRISPDGQTVAYVASILSDHPKVVVKPAAGGSARVLIEKWGFGAVEWSPDSLHLLTIAGGFRHPNRLKLVELATGESRTIARGYFSGMDFSPLGDQFVYGVASSQKLFPNANLYVAPVAAGAKRQLTTDNRSLNPVWGPERIAYSRYKRPKRKGDGPKYNLFLIDPVTSTRSRLTNDKVPYLLTGLVAEAWSADGTQLLANFNGQDTEYGVHLDPATGEQRKLGKSKQLEVIASKFSADGTTILGYTGFVDALEGTVVTVPAAGGKATVLVEHAIDPDWTG